MDDAHAYAFICHHNLFYWRHPPVPVDYWIESAGLFFRGDKVKEGARDSSRPLLPLLLREFATMNGYIYQPAKSYTHRSIHDAHVYWHASRIVETDTYTYTKKLQAGRRHGTPNYRSDLVCAVDSLPDVPVPDEYWHYKSTYFNPDLRPARLGVES
ncbi:hypothetical protein BDN72DRAFT_874271 [Pluteus cervinus]|uniref:Uncharacterized protein n=1 Tax=Pluteus cervinus TaxID=181527 RepID=A0ACD3BDC0_9AGAR|nr:hypothetical protein BDN72DRAFT_874271 [Pluteus cervinus]